MENSQSSEVSAEAQHPTNSQTETVKPKPSDVDLANVRGLMFALISICMFCVSILFGPDKDILPADGNLLIPIANVEVARGSFLYFGPILIIFVSFYTYLFVFRILMNLKEGQGHSDQYIFTMNSSVARSTTYCIFFWFPALVLFGFVYKALPRPESTHVLGIALIFLISIISLQVSLHVQPKYFWVLTVSTLGFVAIVLSGFVGSDGGWLASVRDGLHTLRPLTLVKVELKNKDLRRVDISNANARSIDLQDSKLDDAKFNNAILSDGNLQRAHLQDAKLNCTKLARAQLQEADLRKAELGGAILKEADLSKAKLKRTDFYQISEQDKCGSINAGEASLDDAVLNEGANLEAAVLNNADLIEANLSNTSLAAAELDGVKMKSAIVIKATLDAANLTDADMWKADLRCSSLNEADLPGANLMSADLYGAKLKEANLDDTNLREAKFNSFNCNNTCVLACIECKAKNKANKKEQCKECKNCESGEGRKKSNLENASLRHADLSMAHLNGAILTNADLLGANLYKAELKGATLKDANLFLANFTSVKELSCEVLDKAKNWETAIRKKGAEPEGHECGEPNLNFKGIDFSEMDKQIFQKTFSPEEPFEEEEEEEYHKILADSLKGALLKSADLESFDLHSLNLSSAQLDEAILIGADFKLAQLQKASLKDADLVGAQLQNADLTGAQLQRALLRRANVTDTIFDEADLEGANLKEAVGLTCEQLNMAKNWEKAYRASNRSCGASIPAD